jgi:hypothetical protein
LRDDNFAIGWQEQHLRRDRQKFAQVGQWAHRSNTLEVRIGLIIAGFCLLDTATVQAEIHKCTGADGGIVYSQLPCAPQKPVEAEKTEPDEKAETVQPVSAKRESPVTEHPQEEPESEASTAACKKRHRDAIDAIDAEIGREYSREKGTQYKQRLLVLTRKLRQC